MTRRVATFTVLLSICCVANGQPATTLNTVRIPVAVTNPAAEQQARRLASAVLKELKRDPRFTLVEHPAAGAVEIALPAHVGWERRLDWTEILFQARLNAGSGKSSVIAGRCYNWNMSVCANQILDAAARVAAN